MDSSVSASLKNPIANNNNLLIHSVSNSKVVLIISGGRFALEITITTQA
jgi:hypothetical protein